MKVLPEVYYSVMEMIEAVWPESRLSSCACFAIPGHDVQSRIPEYMSEACFCVHAEDYDMFTYSETT